ncbi:MAG: type IV toxin-antitoxin system AbiEi family antitoxin [Proteobacteria bacterium]|nr:type IV toxin-antitoxin system AbiEi family antitoxin [Pseudomonadota bacterium]
MDLCRDQSLTVAAHLDVLQAGGRYTFTSDEVAAATGRSSIAVQSALRRLRQMGRIATPRRGFHVIVPLEYRSAGSPPPSWFIDDLMRHLGHTYYVGILTAAALHGAAHQQPMVFHVVADGAARPMTAGRGTIEVHASRSVGALPVTRVQTETGTMAVGTPETTAFDLVRFPAAAGHWSHVATVLAELAESLDGARLVEVAPRVRLPDVQRLGWLLGFLGEGARAEPLATWLSGRRTTVVRLRTDRPADVLAVDPTWRLIPNEQVEADL